jgi:hypothetical protein
MIQISSIKHKKIEEAIYFIWNTPVKTCILFFANLLSDLTNKRERIQENIQEIAQGFKSMPVLWKFRFSEHKLALDIHSMFQFLIPFESALKQYGQPDKRTNTFE